MKKEAYEIKITIKDSTETVITLHGTLDEAIEQLEDYKKQNGE